MNSEEAKKVADAIFEEVFGIENPYSLEELHTLLAQDINLPKKHKTTTGEGETWGNFAANDKVSSQAGLIERSAKDEFMRPKKPIGSINELLKQWDEVNIKTGERYLESKEVLESDGIYNSSNIYRSQLIFGSQYMIYCYHNASSKYLLASWDNQACTFGIRFDQSGYCSSSYDVVWSNKVSKSMFILDSFDLYECIFCSHLRSKKYCVANMQFSKEEYMKIKEMVLKWTLDGFQKKLKK